MKLGALSGHQNRTVNTQDPKGCTFAITSCNPEVVVSEGFPNPNKISAPKMPKVNVPGLKPKSAIKLAVLGAAFLIGFGVLQSSFVSIDANEIGVQIVRGRVKGTLPPGWHIVSPIGTKVTKFSTRLQQTSMLRGNEGDRSTDDSVQAASREGATIAVDITVNYRLDPAKAVKLFNTIRSEDDLLQRVVRPGVRSVTRDVFAQYNAREAITVKRGEIQVAVIKGLEKRFAGNSILIETVDIRELYLPSNLQEQVNQAIGAEAAAQRATIERKQKETEAETARLVAEKSAERAIIDATAQAKAARIKADGEAQANRAIAESLTPGLIQLRQIEAVYKNGNQIYFLPQGASPNVFLTPTQNVGTPASPSVPTPAQQQAAAEATPPASTVVPPTTAVP
jgi:regulator of protease activity HflC (stomatin/prohibitin superfamily)